MRGKIAIVGIGEVPTGRYPERSAIQCAIEAARLAIQDSGVDKDQIDAAARLVPGTVEHDQVSIFPDSDAPHSIRDLAAHRGIDGYHLESCLFRHSVFDCHQRQKNACRMRKGNRGNIAVLRAGL